MANYTKTTNFTAKDSLPSGNAAKKILGSLFDTEFNNISTAIATKANLADTTFTGSTTLAQLTLDSGASVTAILDEDDMASNSATAVTTQQSTKAFVLATVTDIGALLVTGTPAANDFAKFTSAAEIVGRSYAETRADLSLEVGTDVQAYDADTAKLDVVQTFTTTQTWTKGADVASATELPLVTDGNYFDVTGTATTTSFANLAVGTVFKLHFDGAMILTNNTDIVCLSGANVTTAAGDEAEFVFFEAGKVRMTNYSPASGAALVSAAGGSLVFIAAATASSSATIEFTGIDDTYDEYEIHILNSLAATDGVGLWMRTSTDGGSSFDSGASDYGWVNYQVVTNGAGAGGAATDSKISFITADAGNLAGEELSLIIRLVRPSEATNTRLFFQMGGADRFGARALSITGSGHRISAADVDAIQFLMSSGNIASGLFSLYGVKRS